MSGNCTTRSARVLLFGVGVSLLALLAPLTNAARAGTIRDWSGGVGDWGTITNWTPSTGSLRPDDTLSVLSGAPTATAAVAFVGDRTTSHAMTASVRVPL